MFAPNPAKHDTWFVAATNLTKNNQTKEWDLARNVPLSFEKPEKFHKLYRTQRWRKYMVNLHSQPPHQVNYVKYLCLKYKAQYVNFYQVTVYTSDWGKPKNDPLVKFLDTYNCTVLI